MGLAPVGARQATRPLTALERMDRFARRHIDTLAVGREGLLGAQLGGPQERAIAHRMGGDDSRAQRHHHRSPGHHRGSGGRCGTRHGPFDGVGEPLRGGGAARASAARARALDTRGFGRCTYKIWWSAANAHLIIARSLSPTVSHQTIVVLDFGSQFTQLIARRLRELSVYSEILPFDTPAAEIAGRQPAGIILSGGPKSVSEEGAPRCEAAVFDGRRADPRHLLRDAADDGDARRGSGAGAASRVRPGQHPHRPDAPLFASVPEELRVWASHGDFVAAAPAGFAVTATSANAPVAAMAAPDRRMYALLFHPEVAHTDRGTRYPPQLRLRNLRLHRRLDDGLVRGRGNDRGSASRLGGEVSSAA